MMHFIQCHSFKLIFLIICLVASPSFAEPVKNSFLIDSPWSQSHRTPGMQASTPYEGIVTDSPVSVQLRDFKDRIDKNLGVSPWLVLSSQKYSDRPKARSVWGASLKGAYKFLVDGETFEYVDHIDLAGFQSISWNLVGIRGSEGERIIVPQPRVLGGGKFLVLKDDYTSDSRIQKIKEFNLDEEVLIKFCKPPERWKLGYSGTSIIPLPTGQLAFTLRFKARWYQKGDTKKYVGILDNSLSRVLACSFIDDDDISNQVTYEAINQYVTALYYPTDTGIVKLEYNARGHNLKRLWKKHIPFRERTGTTPTMLDVGKDKLIVTVDGKCAVTKVFSGGITCSDDQSPSKIYAIKRDTPENKVYSLSLPSFIETIECSPAAEGNQIVVANYAGYKADHTKRGVVSAFWNSGTQKWQLAWSNPVAQISGVPTISTGSHMVYGTGTDAQSSENVFLYGLDLKTGETKIKIQIGSSDRAWDAGNNLLINDDRSMLYSTPTGLARIKNN